MEQRAVLQPVTMFKNLPSPLILGIDDIDNLGITYFSRTMSFFPRGSASREI
jgi:hypothetical protein